MQPSGRSSIEIFRRISNTSNVMGRLTNVWRQLKLSFSTKIHLFNGLFESVLLYGAETWTKSDEQKLEALHISCRCRILGIRWYDFLTNVEGESRQSRPQCCVLDRLKIFDDSISLNSFKILNVFHIPSLSLSPSFLLALSWG